MSAFSHEDLEMLEEEDSLFDQRELLIHNRQTTQETIKWKQKVVKTVALSMAFLCVGLCVAIPGPTLLELGRRVGRDTEHMTYIFTARSVGFLVGSLVGGILFDFFDQQILLFYTLSIVAVATAGIPWCTALLTLSALVSTQGLAIGVLDTGGSVFCLKIWGKRSAPFMQVLHFAFGIGAFLAPLIARPFLFGTDIFDNTTLGSYHAVISLNGNRFARSVSASGIFFQDHTVKTCHHDYRQQILADDTGHGSAGSDFSVYSSLWYNSYLKNSTRRKHVISAGQPERISGVANSRLKRESLTNQSSVEQTLEGSSNPEMVSSYTPANVTSTPTVGLKAARPKKPVYSKGEVLSKEGADASKADSILSDFIKNPPKHTRRKHVISAGQPERISGVANSRLKRESLTNQSSVEQTLEGSSNTDMVSSYTPANVTSTPTVGLKAARPKKPVYSKGEVLSKEGADASKADSILSDYIKNPPKHNLQAEKVTTAGIKGTGQNVTESSGHVWASINVSAAWSSINVSEQSTGLVLTSQTLPTVVFDSSAKKTLSVTAATVQTVTATTTFATTTSTVTSTPNTTTEPPTTAVRETATSTTAVRETTTSTTAPTSSPPSSGSAETTESATTLSTVTAATAVINNKSTAMKPEATGELLNDMVSTLTGMSKIQFAYTAIGLLLAVTAGLFLCLHYRDRWLKSPALTRHHHSPSRHTFSSCFVISVILLLFFFFLAYMGMEVTFGGLLMTFAVEFPVDPLSPSDGAALTAIFWGCLAFGRGCSIVIARCVKPSRMMLMNLSLTMFGALILSIPFNPAALWVGTVTFGLGMSSIFPTAISWADSCYPLSSKATAVFVAGCGVGEMTVPILTGYLYETTSKMAVMYMMMFLSCLLFVLYFLIQVLVYRKLKSGQHKPGFTRLKNVDDQDDDDEVGIAEGITLGITETIWRRRLQAEEDKNKETSEGINFTELTRLTEM